MTFYLTFGQKSPLRNGWIEINAPDMEFARELAFDAFGEKFAFVYEEKNFDKRYFPAGQFGETMI